MNVEIGRQNIYNSVLEITRVCAVSFLEIHKAEPDIYIVLCRAVLKIHDILVSADPCLWLMDPDPDPPIFVIDLQDANKKLI
jgi:hypothetical protein